MENTRKFETYNKEIQKFIIDIGMYEYERRDFTNLSDNEVIMKINSINKSDSDDFYQDKIRLLEETMNKYKKEQELSYGRHQDELKEKESQINGEMLEKVHALEEQLKVNEKEKEEEVKLGIQNEINTRERIHEVYVQNLNEKINIQKDHQHEIDLQKEKEISYLQDQNKLLDKQNDKEITSLRNEKEKEILSLQNRADRAEGIMDEFCRERMLKDKEKGQHAEGVLEDILTRCLPFDTNAIHIPTEDIPGSGDCIINFSQKYNNLRLMVEMKFKTAITQKDKDQFRTHYKDDFKNKKIDLAMMISYGYKYITGYGDCLFPKYDQNNKKVIYFALDGYRCPAEKEKIIISVLESICERYLDNNKDIETENTSNNYVIHIEERLKEFKNNETYINKVIKALKNQVKESEENKDNLERNRNILIHELYKDGTIDKINPTLLDENIDQLKIEFFNDIKQLMKNKNVSLIQPNKSGKRNKWKDTLKKDLEIPIKPYEKKMWDKMKPDDLI